MPSRRPSLPRVAVVSKNRETVDGLHAYFTRAGVMAQAMRSLTDARAFAPPTAAVVIFPDDLQGPDVLAALDRLREAKPASLVVLVTAEPRRFSALASAPDAHVVVLPKPAFGWTILDAIRAHAATPSGAQRH